MKNIEKWKPTKFSFKNGRLSAGKVVPVGSMLMANLVARNYSDLLPKYAKGKLLDLGCGNVPMYEAYKDSVEDVDCVDWGNTEHSDSHLDYLMDLNEPLDLPSNEYDTIILSDVLEHIKNPKVLVSEVSRILKPGGVLLLNVPFYYWLHETPHDYHRYTEYALRDMAENAGLQVEKIWAIAGSPAVFIDLLVKHINKIPLLGNAICWVLNKLTWWFINSIGKSISNKTAQSFPFGYFLVAKK
jgi:SAM-dependent methyltransferase